MTVQKLFSINEHHAACWTTIAWEKILCFHSAAVFLKIEPGPLSKYDATKLTIRVTFNIQYQKLPQVILIGYLPDWQYLQKCISYFWIKEFWEQFEKLRKVLNIFL